MRTLILTDNFYALNLAKELDAIYHGIDVFQSPSGSLVNVEKLNVREELNHIIKKYKLVISIHSKQIFPADLVHRVRCVNVHPGFNPYNRGWFPQVFSIINGLKAGVTIHEIDQELDHGLIIAQKEYKIKSWDTSDSIYTKLMDMERELLLENFLAIRDGKYNAYAPEIVGNLNYKADFERLKFVDLDEHGCFRDFLNRLRALTYSGYQNAYFIDEDGKKIFVTVTLKPEEF